MDAYFVVTGHWIEEESPGVWHLQMGLLGFVQVNNSHSGLRLGQVLFRIIERLGICHKVGHVTCDNASNNSTMLETLRDLLESEKQVAFDPAAQRVRYALSVYSQYISNATNIDVSHMLLTLLRRHS